MSTIASGNTITVLGTACLEIDDDHAVVIKTDVPSNTRYYGFQLAKTFIEALDYANRTGSLNSHQLHIDSDGKIRIVVAKKDPGVPNWLDPEGLDRPFLGYRWLQPGTNPLPVAKVVHTTGET